MFSKIIPRVDENKVTIRCLCNNYIVKINPGLEDYADGIIYQSFNISINQINVQQIEAMNFLNIHLKWT